VAAVKISGFGIVSSLGTGVAAQVDALRRGAADPVALNAFPLPTVAAKVSQVDRAIYPGDEAGTDAMARAALTEAIRRAGAPPLQDCALVCGGNTVPAQVEHAYRRWRAGEIPARPRERSPGNLATLMAQEFDIGGSVVTINTACSSSANALLIGADLITRGRAARALVLGSESLNALSLAGFAALMLLDPEGCRPFDAARRGLQLGEGAAAILLEPGRGEFTLRGGANLCDSHHITSANPDGSGMAQCMTQALAHAGIDAADVVAVKAHGTGSTENDAAEAVALRQVFGAVLPPVTALKRYTGHTLGACGALETVLLLTAMRAAFLPAAAGFAQEDPELCLAPLRTAGAAPRGNYLLNFFGFGGNYASLVVTHDG
jgi:3-oxoacyl-[acyl-carrier-protein] synthase I